MSYWCRFGSRDQLSFDDKVSSIVLHARVFANYETDLKGSVEWPAEGDTEKRFSIQYLTHQNDELPHLLLGTWENDSGMKG